MSATEELAQSHNGIGGSSPMIADNLSTRHEPVVKNSQMNSQEDGPRPVENEVSSAESSKTQDQEAKNEVLKAEEKLADTNESSPEKREEEAPIQKVTFSLLTASVPKSDEKEKPMENSAAHEQKSEIEQPMDVDLPKEKTQAHSESQESNAVAEKSEDKKSKTDETEKTESEKSAEEKKETDSGEKSKEETGAAAEPEEKSRKRGTGRKSASSRSAKKTKTSESAGDEESSTTPKKESPKRGPRKAEKAKEGEEREEEKTPLLEAPLIVEGKRSRQRTERLDSNVLVTPLQKEFEIPEGRGTKFGDIEFIDATISKTSTTDLKILHKLIYGRVGTTPAEIKKNLRLFCGFEFTKDSKEYEKKQKSLDHLVMKDTKTVCKLLGLEVSGRKDELVDTLLSFLIEPKDKGKKLPPTPAATKRKRASRSSGKRASSSRRAKKSGDKSAASDEEEEEAVDEEGGESEAKSHTEGDEPSEEEEPSPKKAKRNKSVATPASTSKRGQPSRSARKAQFPSDTDIKAAIKELLKGVNLEEVTMKEMTTKVYDKFPNVDLTSKKDFIKETVKALLSSSD